MGSVATTAAAVFHEHVVRAAVEHLQPLVVAEGLATDADVGARLLLAEAEDLNADACEQPLRVLGSEPE